MSQVEESVEVGVPVRTAYNQWTQFEEFPLFMESVQRIEQLTPTLTHWEVEINGIRREFDARICEQIPDERVAWTTTAGHVHQSGVVTFHRLSDHRCKIMMQLAFEPEGLAETTADKLGVVRRQVKDDLERFRTFIEQRGSETGAWRGQV
ncbi:SRPBCC family protein [Streptomyces sp. A3M-1-3]|uniref:SRPBCC family protein n=1 Tax=Streptomyces sp. A3M-1-3 TaxID=2962044 RepID=UPI0020B6B210|nr:SRPBCC family protein [Streptomyces sp. A3M-1-3]MCP3820675.1 SRPBCC family protein [Streptomyces sp. A3M-1-3]